MTGIIAGRLVNFGCIISYRLLATGESTFVDLLCRVQAPVFYKLKQQIN